MNLFYCGNDFVFDGMLISLLSITKYTKKALHVYALTLDLQDINPKYKAIRPDQIEYLEKVVQLANPSSRVTLIDVSEHFRKDMMNSPNLKNDYTPYTLVRLYADLLPEIPDRILYLDTDTIAHGNIESIFDIDISEYEMAGCIDYLGKWFISMNYMNAGILYLNMAKIRETRVFERARDLCATKKMWFPDQTALHRLIQKKKFISTRYNEQRRLHKDTVLQHFCKSIRLLPFYHTVNVKPWETERMHRIYKLYEYDDLLTDYEERMKKLREG